MSGYTGLGQREGVQSVALNAWAKMTHSLLPERLEIPAGIFRTAPFNNSSLSLG